MATEYARRLKKNDAEELVVAQRRAFPKILADWASIAEKLVPDFELGAGDFFMKDYSPASGQLPLPDDLVKKLERSAVAPFAEIALTDVLVRWAEDYADSEADRQSVVRDVAHAATPLLGVSEALVNAQRVGEIQKTERLLRKEKSPQGAAFDSLMLRECPNAVTAEAPDAFRAVLIRHYLNFPLTSVPSISQQGGLIEARCDHWPRFHTRADIQWKALPKSATEHELRAAGLVAVALLLRVVKLEGGKLTFTAGDTALGNEARKVMLRGALIEAGSALDRGAPDERGNATRGLVPLLEARVNQIRSDIAAENAQDRNQAFVGKLRSALSDRVGVNVGDYDRITELATDYLSRDEGLRRALIASFSVDDAIVTGLLHRAGEPIRNKRNRDLIAQEDGLYCSECGSLIGSDRDDAAQREWKCQELEHYFGPQLTGV